MYHQVAVPIEEYHMAKGDRNPSDNETIMIALDQISQTIEVMTSVVGRLRTYVQQQESSSSKQQPEASTEIHSDRILH